MSEKEAQQELDLELDVELEGEDEDDNEDLDDLIDDLEDVLIGESFNDVLAALGIVQASVIEGFLSEHQDDPLVSTAVKEYTTLVINEMKKLKNIAESQQSTKH
jgi:hypothetical protein